jgi:hypothetical protein
VLVETVYAIFKRLINDPDETFITSTGAVALLRAAYQEFRELAQHHVPAAYALTLDVTLSGTSLDLTATAPVLLGSAAPSATRLLSLLALYKLDSSGRYAGERLKPSHSMDQLVDGRGEFYLLGTSIEFHDTVSGSHRLVYHPDQSVDWTKTASGDNEFIDDFHGFHEIIAFKAAVRYGLEDGAVDPDLIGLHDRLEDRFVKHLIRRMASNRGGMNQP